MGLFSGASTTSHSSELDSLSRATAWVNSRALTAGQLRGKVVLVQFWTFTCINWLRTMPYVRAWANRYRQSGLLTIGAHAPEFPFERDVANVRRAVHDLKVSYPVAIDNDYAIWKAFGNHYWPALYLVDGTGEVRQHWFGEGEYAEAERAIRQLLRETGSRPLDPDLVSVSGRGIEAAADWKNLKTPETYLGYDRGQNFASPGDVTTDRSRTYGLPPKLNLNEWALAGDWTIRKGAIEMNAPNGRIAFRFHARDVHLVMGPPPGGEPARFRVLLDGAPPAAARGADVDDSGSGMAREQRLYQLIRQPTPITDREVQIEFLDRGVEAFAFTFG